jgi:hypothetical protein
VSGFHIALLSRSEVGKIGILCWGHRLSELTIDTLSFGSDYKLSSSGCHLPMSLGSQIFHSRVIVSVEGIVIK